MNKSMSKTLVHIYDNIPLPERKRQEKWPFSTIKTGQSFVMPGVLLNSAISICTRHRDFGKFAVRRVEENGEYVIRVWRIE